MSVVDDDIKGKLELFGPMSGVLYDLNEGEIDAFKQLYANSTCRLVEFDNEPYHSLDIQKIKGSVPKKISCIGRKS